jgi:hypothetical protein
MATPDGGWVDPSTDPIVPEKESVWRRSAKSVPPELFASADRFRRLVASVDVIYRTVGIGPRPDRFPVAGTGSWTCHDQAGAVVAGLVPGATL